MRALLAVLYALGILLLQALLVAFAVAAVAILGVQARAGASWIYRLMPLASFVISAGAGAYQAVRMTADRFPDVAPDTVYVSLATLVLANVALAAFVALFSSQDRFASNGDAVAFVLASAAVLAGNQLGLWHSKDAIRVASA